MNRLNLNYEIAGSDARNAYIQTYLQDNPTLATSLTETESNTIADYILWGDHSTPKSARAAGLNLKTRWSTASKTESLDALFETPTFNENSIRSNAIPYTVKASDKKFSRAEARAKAPQPILDELESLWASIDSLEFQIQSYELFTSKRTLPIREELLKRLSEASRAELILKAQKWTPRQYQMRRSELKELRTQQLILRDNYAPQLVPADLPEPDSSPFTFTSFYPINYLKSDSSLSAALYPQDSLPSPSNFTEAQLVELTSLLWEPASTFTFDFTNQSHLRALFQQYLDIQDASQATDDLYTHLPQFWETLQYFRSVANLTPLLNELLDLKVQHKSNQFIASHLNAKYSKNYNPNYISTLFYQKIIGEIASAATIYRSCLEQVFFPENWKTCKDCGRTLLAEPTFFMRKARSSTGYSPRCKHCEKLIRDARDLKYKPKEKTNESK